MHFDAISAIYNAKGITRRAIWKKIGKGPVSETSADADLYKLLILTSAWEGSFDSIDRLTTTDDSSPSLLSERSKATDPSPMVSAFDDVEQWELTELGQQVVHYAMSDLPLRI